MKVVLHAISVAMGDVEGEMPSATDVAGDLSILIGMLEKRVKADRTIGHEKVVEALGECQIILREAGARV